MVPLLVGLVVLPFFLKLVRSNLSFYTLLITPITQNMLLRYLPLPFSFSPSPFPLLYSSHPAPSHLLSFLLSLFNQPVLCQTAPLSFPFAPPSLLPFPSPSPSLLRYFISSAFLLLSLVSFPNIISLFFFQTFSVSLLLCSCHSSHFLHLPSLAYSD